jgi:hypothetical protein
MALQSTTALATVTLQAATPTVIFGGIPNTYRDLIIVSKFKTEINVEPKLAFNVDTSSSYSMVQMAGTGSASLSNSGTTTYGWITPNSGASAEFSSYVAQIFDYSVTDKHTTWLSRFNPQEGYVNALGNRWAKTEVINTISIFVSSSNFSAGSSFSLYGRIA